ncbi:MAG TPA: PEP-CTERM sorting domain-containing protein [Phycisphaerae bacterium]|nr:PEP-CTERM sorting domain-containing protein [Phycisphaerae bacterium]
MRRQRGFLWVVVAGAAVMAGGTGAEGFYVQDNGAVTASAGVGVVVDGTEMGNQGMDSHNFSSDGEVAKTRITGTTFANTSGTAWIPDKMLLEPQAAGGNVEDEAEIGALHSTISAFSDAGGADSIDADGVANAHAADTVKWGDVLRFTSSNPVGSKFTLELSLEVAVTPEGNFTTGDAVFGGFFTGEVSASAVIHGLPNMPLTTLGLGVTKSLHADGTVINDSTAPTEAVTFFVPGGGGVAISVDATLQADAFANLGDGQAVIDAGNTAQFVVFSDDPLASYTADSGTVFATAPEVPEPATVGVLVMGAVVMVGRRRGTK